MQIQVIDLDMSDVTIDLVGQVEVDWGYKDTLVQTTSELLHVEDVCDAFRGFNKHGVKEHLLLLALVCSKRMVEHADFRYGLNNRKYFTFTFENGISNDFQVRIDSPYYGLPLRHLGIVDKGIQKTSFESLIEIEGINHVAYKEVPEVEMTTKTTIYNGEDDIEIFCEEDMVELDLLSIEEVNEISLNVRTDSKDPHAIRRITFNISLEEDEEIAEAFKDFLFNLDAYKNAAVSQEPVEEAKPEPVVQQCNNPSGIEPDIMEALQGLSGEQVKAIIRMLMEKI
jgi:hypothetical protein